MAMEAKTEPTQGESTIPSPQPMKPQILLPPPQSATGSAPVQLQPPLTVQPPVADAVVLPVSDANPAIKTVESPVTATVVVQSVPNGGSVTKDTTSTEVSPSRKRPREEMSVDLPKETGTVTTAAPSNDLVEPAAKRQKTSDIPNGSNGSTESISVVENVEDAMSSLQTDVPDVEMKDVVDSATTNTETTDVVPMDTQMNGVNAENIETNTNPVEKVENTQNTQNVAETVEPSDISDPKSEINKPVLTVETVELPPVERGKTLVRERNELYQYLYNMDEDTLRRELMIELCGSEGKQDKALFEAIRGRMHTNSLLCKIFIRSLSYETEDQAVHDTFAEFGDVKEAVIVHDRDTGFSRGFGFITMSNATEAQAALKDDKKIIDGRATVCNLATKPTGNRVVKWKPPISGYRNRSPDRGYQKRRGGGYRGYGRGAPPPYPYPAPMVPMYNPYGRGGGNPYGGMHYPYPAAPINPYAMPYGNPYARPYPPAPAARRF